MRRYLSTIIVLLALLAVGGLILYSNYTSELPRPLFGYPLTPLSSNPTEAQTQALILVVGGGVLVGAVVGTGAALAIAAGRYIAFERSRPAAAAVPATAKAEPRTGEPAQVPLSDQRSLAIFWVTVILLFGAFMLIRNWGTEFGYFPMAELAMIELFRLPGQHINGLPAFVAGPGDMLTAMHLLIAVLGMAMVGTAVTGAVLAFGTVRIAHTLKVADRMPRTRLDRMLAPLLYLGKPPAEVMGAAAPARPRPLVERILLG
ncbi:MAG TPA: hypothetical protein VJA19_08270, partial [Pseudomonas sp.]|nr:hypothetical protein [Pseudomonas sp.]